MPFVTLPIGEWMPDQFPIGSPGALTITNVVPRTPTTYGPMPTPTASGATALLERCIGSYTMQDTADNVYVFAGDQVRLYLLQAGSGFTPINSTAYQGQPWPDTQWAFTSFGLRTVACNYVDLTQTFLVGTDTVFSDLSAAPRARFCEAVGDFVMLGHTQDGTSGVQPQRVWWCAIGDPTSWPTPGTTAAIQVQSDYQDLQQTDLGQITGLAAGPLPTASVTIFCEHGVYTGSYVGSPAIFAFKAVDGAPGCQAPSSIVKGHINSGGSIVPVIYYKAPDGWYAFNGTSSVGIGANKIDRFVQAELDPKVNMTVLGAADPASKLIYWAYSTTASPLLYDRLVVYNWDVNRWSYVDLTNAKLEYFALPATATIGYTLEELDQFGTLDTLPYSLDSEAWVGGTPRFGVFNSSHQLAYLTGANMAATVETAEVEPVPGKRAFIRNARPLVDATGGSVAIAVREREADSLTVNGAVLMNAMGECPQRRTGRFAKARFTLPAATSFNHIAGVELDVIPQGIR